MVHSEEVISSIKEALPDAQVIVEDLSGGGGDHLNVNVVSSAFIGLTRVQQHQLIYKALMLISLSEFRESFFILI